MYNRYIGNTGKFYRVEDAPRQEPQELRPMPESPPLSPESEPDRSPPPRGQAHAPSLAELTGGLKGLVGGFLPSGMELGDLLLILVLLLLYLEKEDEELLIVLFVLIFMGFN